MDFLCLNSDNKQLVIPEISIELITKGFHTFQDNMASSSKQFGNLMNNSEFAGELLKFKKEYLIDIIITRKVPEGVNVTPGLRKFIEENSEENLGEPANICPDPNNDNLQSKSSPNNLYKGDRTPQLMELEIGYLKRALNTLEQMVSDKNLIIELLKGNQLNLKTLSLNDKGDVAVVNKQVLGLTNVPDKKEKQNRSQQLSDHKRKELTSNKSIEKEVNAEKQKKGSKYPVVQGTAKSSSFSGAPKYAWIHVGRAGLETDENSVEKHLKLKFPDKKFIVAALPQRDGATSRSFKVGGSLDIVDQLYKSENWPENISIKRYHFFRNRDETQKK